MYEGVSLMRFSPMKSILLSLVLLLNCCLSGRAQFGVEQPFFLQTASASQFTPQSIDHLGYWWVSSDVQTNVTVTNWVDRIASASWTNGADSKRPTNSASGVHFVRASSQQLTNTPGITFAEGSGDSEAATHFFIIRPDAVNVFQAFLIRSISVSSKDFGITSAALLYLHIAPTISTDGALAANNWYDVAITCKTGPESIFYTNGVPSSTNAFNLGTGVNEWKCFGGNSGGGYLGAYVRELAIWTNYTMTSLEVSNLHRYATNTYAYSP